MPPKRKEEIEVTTVGRVNSLPTTNSQSSSPPCYTTAHESQNNSTRENSLPTTNPQTSVIITEDGDMPMQEDVRLNIALVSVQTANGSQIECPTPNRELPPRILYDGKYHWLCVVLFAERSVHCACVFSQIGLAR